MNQAKRASAFLVCLLGLLLGLPAFAGTLTVDMLDVGQGDSILIRTESGKTALIDTGTGKPSLLPVLQGLGVKSIDLLVTTHPHADHIGGLVPVLQSIPINLYVDNGQVHPTPTYDAAMKAIEARGIRYKTAEIGQVYRLGPDVSLEVLFPGKSPLRGTRSDVNSNSVVLRLEHQEKGKAACMLLMGDAEEPTEQRLIEGGLKSCEVLKVAHHGGNHSSTDAFLKKARPKVALISVGAKNNYGHPGRQSLARLARVGATVYRTDESGNLRVLFDEDSIEVLEGIEIPLPPVVPAQTTLPGASTFSEEDRSEREDSAPLERRGTR